MINHLVRCISLMKLPSSMTPSRTILRGLKIPVNSVSISNCDFLLSRKGFSSSASRDTQNGKKPSKLVSPVVGQENQNDEREEEEEIPEELKLAMETDPTLSKRYKILQLEVDVMRHAGKLVPDQIKPMQWIQLLKEETRSARKRYLQFLFTVEKKQENHKKKKELARLERDTKREFALEEVEGTEYRLHKVAIFMRIYDTTMNHFYHSRLVQAMMFGEKLIIDCGYYDQMTPRECTECAKQLAYTFAQNRVHKEPFDLHFCNVNKSSLLMQKFNRIMPTAYESEFPLNISEKSYLESFDKNKLVYLTPHCNNEMKDYDPDSTYIVGAIVDKTNSDPLSLARAKKDGLRMAKLPLNKYLLWGSGSGKRLPLNQMVGILADLRVTRDWQQALRHIPKRKLERSIDDLGINSTGRTKIFERFNTNSNNYNKPFRPYEQKTQSSFSFRDRQKRTLNK